MANVVGESVSTVSDQLTAVWNNFAKGGENLEYYADVLTKLGAATASSSDEIVEGVGKFAAVADTVGLSYEYAAAALATITAETRQSADVVGTSLKTLLSRLESLELGETLDDETTLTKYSAALAAVGVDIKDTNGALKDMDTILDETGAKWKQLSNDQQVALAQTVAGVRQYSQFIALMENWDEVKVNVNLAYDSTGTLEEQQQIFEEGWEGASNRVSAAFEGLYAQIIDDDAIIDITNAIAKIVSGASDIIEKAGGLKTILAGVGGIIAQLAARHIPQALSNIAYNINTIFNSSKMTAEIFDDMETSLNNYKQASAGLTAGESAELTNNQRMLEIKKSMALNDGTLSTAQKERLNFLLQEYQVYSDIQKKNFEKLDALAKEKERLEENLQKEKEILETKRQQAEQDVKKAQAARGNYETKAQDRDAKKVSSSFKELDNYVGDKADVVWGNRLDNLEEAFSKARRSTRENGSLAYSERTNLSQSYQDFVSDSKNAKIVTNNRKENAEPVIKEVEKLLKSKNFGNISGTKDTNIQSSRRQSAVAALRGMESASGGSFVSGLSDEILDETKVTNEQAETAIQEAVKRLQEWLEKLQNGTIDVIAGMESEIATGANLIRNENLAQEKSNNLGSSILSRKEQFEKAGVKFDGSENEVASVQKALDEKKTKLDAAEKALETATKELEEADSALKKAEEALKADPSEENQNKVNEAKKKKQSAVGKKGAATKKQKKAKEEYNNLSSLATDEGNSKIEELGEALENVTEKEKEAKEANARAADELERYQKEADAATNEVPKLSTNLATLGGTAMTVVSSISMMASAWDTLTDSEADFSDKLMALTMGLSSLGTAGGSVINTFKSFSDAVKKAQKAQEAAAKAGEVAQEVTEGIGDATGEAIKGLVKQSVATEGSGAAARAAAAPTASFATAVWSVVGPVLLVVAALAALVAIIWVCVKAYKAAQAASPEGRLKTETAALERYSEALEDAKSKQEEFNSTLDSYNSVKDSLADMTDGTVEYKQAVYEANEQALKLVELYPKLKEAMHWEGGVITFDDGALEAAQEAQYWEVMQAQALKNNQQHRVEYTQAEVAAKGIGKNAQDKYNEDNNVSEKKWYAGLSTVAAAVGAAGTALTAAIPGVREAFLAATGYAATQAMETFSALETIPDDISETIQSGLVTKLEENGTEGLDNLKSAIQEFATKSQNGEGIDNLKSAIQEFATKSQNGEGIDGLDDETKTTLKTFFTDDYATYLSDNESQISEYLEKYGEIITEGKNDFLQIALGNNYAGDLSDADKKKYFGTDEETATAREGAYNAVMAIEGDKAAQDSEYGNTKLSDVGNIGNETISALWSIINSKRYTDDTSGALNFLGTRSLSKDLEAGTAEGGVQEFFDKYKDSDKEVGAIYEAIVAGGSKWTKGNGAQAAKDVMLANELATEDELKGLEDADIFSMLGRILEDKMQTLPTQEVSPDTEKKVGELFANAKAEGAQAVQDVINEAAQTSEPLDISMLIEKMGVTDIDNFWDLLGGDGLTDDQKQQIAEYFNVVGNDFEDTITGAIQKSKDAVNKNWLTEQGVKVDEDASEETIEKLYERYAKSVLGWTDDMVDAENNIIEAVKKAKKETDKWYDSLEKVADTTDTLNEGFEDINDVYQDFKDGKSIIGEITDNSDFGQSVISMSDQSVLDKFQQKVKEANGDVQKTQEAFNELVGDIVDAQLDKLGDDLTTEGVDNLIESFKELGITLDETTQKSLYAVADINEATEDSNEALYSLKTIMANDKATSEEFTAAIANAQTALQNLGYTTDETKTALFRYYVQAVKAGNYSLTTSASIQNLQALASAAGVTCDVLAEVANGMKAFEEGNYVGAIRYFTRAFGADVANKIVTQTTVKKNEIVDSVGGAKLANNLLSPEEKKALSSKSTTITTFSINQSELDKAISGLFDGLGNGSAYNNSKVDYSGAPADDSSSSSSGSDDDSWKDDKKDYDTSSPLDDLERYVKLEHQLDRLEEAYDDVSDAVDNAFGVQRQKMYDKLAQKLKDNIKLLKEEKKAAEDYLSFDAANYNSQIKSLMSNQEFAAMASQIGINLSNYLISDGLVKSVQAGTASDAEVGELQEKAANTEKYLEEILRQITNKYTYVYNNTNWSDQDTRDNWWDNFENNIQKSIEDLIDNFSSSASNLTDSIDKLIDVGDQLKEKTAELVQQSIERLQADLDDGGTVKDQAQSYAEFATTVSKYYRSDGKRSKEYELAAGIDASGLMNGRKNSPKKTDISLGSFNFTNSQDATNFATKVALLSGGKTKVDGDIVNDTAQISTHGQATVVGKALGTAQVATALLQTKAEGGLTEASTEDIVNLFNNAQSQIQESYEYLVEQTEKLASLYTDLLDEIDDSLSSIQSRIDFDKDSVTGLANIMQAYRKQVVGSEAAYRKLLKQSEDVDISNLKNKGTLAATYKGYYEKAKADYDEAVEKKYDDDVVESLKSIMNAAQEQYQEAYEDFTSSAEELATTISDNFSASVESILSDATDALDEYNDAFEKATSISEDYLDSFNKNYELTKLISKIDTSINDTKSVKAKKALNELQAQILKKQKSGEEISEYEVEALTKQYELQLAMYELEEAKNAKSTVRLSRDAEGNLNYVYTADEDQLSEAQSNLNDKLAEYYNLNQNRVKTLQSTYLSLLSSFKDEINSLSIKDFENEAAYKAAVDNIKAYYMQKLANVEAEMGVVQTNNSEFFEQYKAALVDMGVQAAGQYEGMTNKAKTELQNIYQECLTQKINLVGEDGEGGLVAQIESAATESFKSLGTVISDTTTALNNLTGENGNGTQKNLGDLAKAATKLGDEFNDAANTDVAALNKQIETLLGTNSDLYEYADNVKTKAEDLNGQFGNIKDTIQTMIDLSETFLKQLAEMSGMSLNPLSLDSVDGTTVKQFAQEILSAAVGTKKKSDYTEEQWKALDIDGDGKISVTDAQQALQYLSNDKYVGTDKRNSIMKNYQAFHASKSYTTARSNTVADQEAEKTYNAMYSYPAVGDTITISKGISALSLNSGYQGTVDLAGTTSTVNQAFGGIKFKVVATDSNGWQIAVQSSKDKNKYWINRWDIEGYENSRNFSYDLHSGRTYDYEPYTQQYKAAQAQKQQYPNTNANTNTNINTQKALPKKGDIVTVKADADLYSGDDMITASWTRGQSFEVREVKDNGKKIRVLNEGRTIGCFNLSDLVGYDTGGYTGEWGPEGRLAFLHQKEIVLNKADTQNLLSSVEMLRNISNKLDLQALASKFDVANFAAPTVAATASTIPVQQDVKIEASFPNVTDSSEIEAALNNLVNEAVQYTTQLY